MRDRISRPLEPKDVPYGVAKFKELRDAGRYYVDKTAYIRKLEQRADFLFFVRPRRFGKSLFVDMLRCYYDLNEKQNFERLFGDLDIGKNPTENANKYQVLALDFSQVNKGKGLTLEERFDEYMRTWLLDFANRYSDCYESSARAAFETLGSGVIFDRIKAIAAEKGYQLYLLIDEYDNFTNQLIRAEGNTRYEGVTHGEGFYREWFKSFKGTFSRIFMTGVSPVTMDDLTSGFNIATNISQGENYNAMIGFTKEETRKIFTDFQGVGEFVNDIDKHIATVEKWYDGYCFAKAKAGEEHIFNCDMVLYYLNELVEYGRPPENLIDGNIKSDWGKLAALLAIQKHAEIYEGVLPLTDELADHGEVTFPLVEAFQIKDVVKEENFKSLYYYYGIVTMSRVAFEGTYFKVPNECVRRQIFEYMRGQYSRSPEALDVAEFNRRFNDFALRGVAKPLFEYLADRFAVNSVVRDGLNGELLINGFMRAYLTMRSGYMACPELELNGRFCDYAFFPDQSLVPELRSQHSYVIELKHSKKTATEAEIAAKHAEALDQLAGYARHPNLTALAAGTPVHFLDVEFKGREMIVCEEVVMNGSSVLKVCRS